MYLAMSCLVIAAPPFGGDTIKIFTPATVLVYIYSMHQCNCKPCNSVDGECTA